jgi:5-methyltetrahydrofolate--homocysteine methyltransferase
MDTVLRSRSKTVVIGARQPFCVIGERINPTGRKSSRRSSRTAISPQVLVDLENQLAAGANMVDVNAGIPLVDEAELLAKMLRTVQDTADVPICIDSSVIEALEAGLAVYEGKPLVNSVTGEDDRLEEILPLVARHGAAVIGLANDETGIPETPQQRLDIARKIVQAAADHGIPAEDVVIDPLAMTVGADTEAVTTTLTTISLIRDELGVNMCLGASNVSFGLPQRHVLNAAFLPMAMAAGLTSAIMSTAPVVRRRVRGRRPAARPRPVGRALDRRAPRARRPRGGRDPPSRHAARHARRRRARPAALRAGRRGGARARRHADLRRRELERRSRSTPRAAATARARSARCACSRATCRSPPSTRARSRPTSCATAGGSPAARPRTATW